MNAALFEFTVFKPKGEMNCRPKIDATRLALSPFLISSFILLLALKNDRRSQWRPGPDLKSKLKK